MDPEAPAPLAEWVCRMVHANSEIVQANREECNHKVQQRALHVIIELGLQYCNCFCNLVSAQSYLEHIYLAGVHRFRINVSK